MKSWIFLSAFAGDICLGWNNNNLLCMIFISSEKKVMKFCSRAPHKEIIDGVVAKSQCKTPCA